MAGVVKYDLIFSLGLPRLYEFFATFCDFVKRLQLNVGLAN